MRIALLIGNQSNQDALADKISARFDVCAIVRESRRKKKSRGISYVFNKILDQTLFGKIGNSWNHMLNFYKESGIFPNRIPFINTEDINKEHVIDFLLQHKPDIVFVSGTSLLKKDLILALTGIKIINLHTGLSPYVKGGPNCTNWCIANNTMHFIGNTIMWLNEGIDSGNIIASETVNLDGSESLNEIHIKVMENAHDLALKSLNYMKADLRSCPSVPQKEISEGQLFFTSMWNLKAKTRFAINVFTGKFKKTIKSKEYLDSKNKLITIKLPDI
jgi:methionyl-tRNA formyltransferase